MRIRLGVFVGCMLFLAYGLRAEEDGKSKRSVPESGTSVSSASDTDGMDNAALFPAVSEVCGYRSRDESRAAFQTAVERGEIPDPSMTSPPAVAPRAIRGGGGACAPTPQTSDIFLFEDSAGLLLTNFSEGQLFSLMTSAANALIVAEGDNFDFVGFWVSFVPHHQLGSAFYLGLENDVAGIGQAVFNDRPFFGQAGDTVEGYIMMWNINDGLWAAGTAGDSASFTRLVLAQEIEHRWGVFIPSLLDGRSMQGNNVCGRFSHWNKQIDGQGSGMEMREWIGSSPAVLGGNCVSFDPTECFNSDIGGVFSYTDLYLMGFVSPAEMDAGNSELRFMDAGCSSPYNGSISTFSSADIEVSAGTRSPASAASQHDFHIGWIMFHQPGDPPNTTELDKAVGILAQQSIDWEFSTLGVGTLNNTLQGDCTFGVKFSQRPTPDGENIASNIDWTDDDPNVVVADDFISDGRPINSVRWWGSDLALVTGGDEPTDDCNASPSVNEGTFSFSNVGADTDGPAGACASNGADVWIDYVPTCTGTATIDTCGSTFDTVLEVFDGCSCDPLGSLLGCNDDDCNVQSSLSVPVTAGQCIKVRISGFIGAEGTGTLHIGCSVCSEPGSCEMRNGGFEDGEFCNWTATSNGLGEFFPWVVGAVGTTTGFHSSSPIEGTVDAINGFDGQAGLVYELFQDVALPAATTIMLTTNHRIQYDSLGIPSNLPRELDISIRDTGNTILTPLFHQDVLVDGAPNTDLGWNTQVFDISAFAGQTIRIHFEEFIPESATGPAMIEFDDITLACTGPAAGSSASSGRGSEKTTRIIALKTATPRGAVAFEELRERYLGMRENALAAANGPREVAPPTTRRVTAEDLAKYGETASWPYGQVANARVPTDSGFGPDGFTETVNQVVLNAPGTVATNGVNTRFLAGADFGNDGDFSFMFALDADTNELVRLDVVTAVSTLIGSSVPAGVESWTGMAMDLTSGTMYASATDGCVTSAIYTIDLAAGTATKIGDVANTDCIIAIAIDNNGQMYGMDIINDTLVSIDKSTGAGAVVGPIGFDAGFSQGMDFDETDGTLYLAAVNVGAGIMSELYTINAATGLATLVGNLGATAPGAIVEFDGFGIAAGGGGSPIFASDPQGANLGTVDPLTGFFTVIGPFTGAVGNVTELEWDPTGTTLYATTGGGTSTINTVDPTTGTILTTVAHTFGALTGLEFDAVGNLLGTEVVSGDLVLVDPSTGALVTIGPTGAGSNIGGLAFDAGFTTLYGITSGGAAVPPTLLDVNPVTGAAVAIAVVSVAVEMSSLEFTSNGQLVAGGADGILYEIDTVTGVATAVGPLVNAGKVSGLSVKPGGAIPSVPKPDGWFISFHEPLVEDIAPQPPLGLYFCDEDDVQISTTASPACDGHTVREYLVDLARCCLVHANVDSRTGLIPAQIDGFFEEECFAYAIDIQAVVGHKFFDDGGTCIEVSTGKSWDSDVWGWHSTMTEIGAAFGLGPALQTVVSMSGADWLYGPWGPVDITCGQRNMAFELITDTPNEEDPDLDGDGVPDVCNPSPPLPALPPHDAQKNRYISIDPNNSSSDVAFEVTLSDLRTCWVGEPCLRSDLNDVDPQWLAECVQSAAGDGSDMVRDWSSYTDPVNGNPVVHVRGCVILPNETYDVRAIAVGGVSSAALTIGTVPDPEVGSWADIVGEFIGGSWTAPNSNTNFHDIGAGIQGFQQLPTAAPVSWVDLVDTGGAEVPNYVINFNDVGAIIKGFLNTPYPGTVATCAIPATADACP